MDWSLPAYRLQGTIPSNPAYGISSYPSAASVVAGSQGRVDAARTAAVASDAERGALPYHQFGMGDRGAGPAPSTSDPMRETYGAAVAGMRGGQVPSAEEAARQQAAQAAEIQQRRQGMQSDWLAQQGVSPRDQRAGVLPITPDRAMREAAMPGRYSELDYSGFAAPGTRIFGSASPGSAKMNTFVGAGLPSMESAGGKGQSAVQQVGGTLAAMSQKLAGLSNSTDVRSMMERKSLRRSIAELSGVHQTLAQHEVGLKGLEETGRATKVRERQTGAAQAMRFPDTQVDFLKAMAAWGGRGSFADFIAASQGREAPTAQVVSGMLPSAFVGGRPNMGVFNPNAPGAEVDWNANNMYPPGGYAGR